MEQPIRFVKQHLFGRIKFLLVKMSWNYFLFIQFPFSQHPGTIVMISQKKTLKDHCTITQDDVLIQLLSEFVVAAPNQFLQNLANGLYVRI